MSELAGISARECLRALAKAGFYVARQHGSHIILRRDAPYAKVVVPDHREIKPNTVRNIIRQADMTVDEFLALLKS